MCGIIGFQNKNDLISHHDDLLKAITAIQHRGPDAEGCFIEETAGIGLGHRRLSIIDLSAAGHQPMHSVNQDAVIVYNGEVFNFRDVRSQLEAKGYKFYSQTDTEVILNAYLEWGEDCLQHFIGMFALAIWDRRKRRLFLARDRLGIKPLYYYYRNHSLIFASELKALMAFRGFSRTVDDEALALYLHYQYIPAPRTIFKDTYKLLPGHYMVYEGGEPAIRSYWKTPNYNSDSGFFEEQEALNELDRLFSQAVSDRLVSDVPIGALLSGGIDSSLVVALMQKASSSAVRTFSIGFRETNYNEAPWASRIAAHLGTQHTELVVESDQALEIIPRLPDVYDEPFADSSAIPTCLVSQLTRSHVKVALSGDGGDEQFAGYVRYWMTRTMTDWLTRIPAGIRKPAALALDRLPARWVESFYLPWRDFLPQRFRVANFADKWQKLILQLGSDQISELYRMTICLWSAREIIDLIGQGPPQSRFEAAFEESASWPILSSLMHVDQNTYLPDCMLTKVDRASMAVGLEVRVPLLDHRVVEFSARLPETMKYHHGGGKRILKKLLARYVPPSLFERPKMGFGVPIDSWLRGPLKALLLDYLSAERLKKEGLFNQNVLNQKIHEHLNGQCNHHYRLWAILMWEMWRERWLA
jgi:asparagine synthase (glutamine-hydrolysing)